MVTSSFVRKLYVPAAALVGYVLLFFPAHALFGSSATAMAVLPVGVVASFGGLRGGLLAGLLAFPLNVVLVSLTGEPGWEVMAFSGLPGSLFLVVVGAVIGRILDLSQITRQALADQSRAQAELARQQAFSADILNHMAEAVVLEDLEGTVTYINPAGAALLGYGPEELIGQHWTVMVPPDQRPIVEAANLRRERGESDRYELQFLTKTGERKMVIISARPRSNEGQYQDILTVFTDITGLREMKEAERQQRSLAEGISKVASLLSRSLDLDEVLGQTLVYVKEVVPHDGANIMLLDSGVAEIIRCAGVYIYQEMEESILGIRFSLDEVPILKQIATSRRPILVADTHSETQWIKHSESAWIRSYLGAPICIEEETIGFINIDSAAPDAFTPAQAEQMKTFADQIAVALYNARLYQESQERSRKLERLSEITRLSNSSLPLPDLLKALSNVAHEVMGGDAAYITRWDETMHRTVPMAATGYLQESYTQLEPGPDEVTLTGSLYRERRTLVISDAFNTPYLSRRIAELFPARSALALPLQAEDRFLGAMILSFNEKHHFSKDEVTWGERVAEVVALAIAKAQAYTGLEKRVEERTAELFRTKERVEAILHSVGEALVVMTPNGLIGQVNPAFEAQTGYSAEEVVRRNHREILLDEGTPRELFISAVSAMRAGQVWRGELPVRRQNGTVYDAAVTVTPMRNEMGEVTAYVGSLRDITPLKEVQRMKDEFVSNVSHELRTPITSLRLNLGLLRRDPERQSVYLERLDRETGRLNNLIEDLLRLSRLDQGRVELKREALSLSALAEEMVLDRTPLAESRGLLLAFAKGVGSDMVEGDLGLLNQVLSVFLTNALNYTPSGGQVVVKTGSLLEDEAWVGFSVSDTGPGISPDELPHLSERFFRGNAGRQSGAPGTGLGLAIAREIIDRHAGKLTIQSSGMPGEGTTMSAWLPLLKKGPGTRDSQDR